LAFYYDNKRKIENHDGDKGLAFDVPKNVLENVLENVLKKSIQDNENLEIMLIAHSMGSIIAYDVLRDIGQIKGNKIKIKHFVTIGSPLGIPHVKRKILDQRIYKNENEVRTPSIVTDSWTNFADRKDPVAIDVHLRDDFKANDSGIRVVDDLVSNDYVGLKGKHNHHKSYGYLRTPELSEKVLGFLKD